MYFHKEIGEIYRQPNSTPENSTKKEGNTCKISAWKEIVKHIAEIIETETKRTKQRIS